MSGECDRCGENAIDCRCNITEHNCEVPGWRCYGNGPIYLIIDMGESSEYSWYSIKFSTEVNYCPFCGFSETLYELSRKNDHA